KFIPEFYPANVGAVGGIVGALGGVGGFFLPLLSGVIKTAAGSVYLQIGPLAVVAAAALGVLLWSERRAKLASDSYSMAVGADWPPIALAVEEAPADHEADAPEEELVGSIN